MARPVRSVGGPWSTGAMTDREASDAGPEEGAPRARRDPRDDRRRRRDRVARARGSIAGHAHVPRRCPPRRRGRAPGPPAARTRCPGRPAPKCRRRALGGTRTAQTGHRAAALRYRDAAETGAPQPILERLRDEANRLHTLVDDYQRQALDAAAGRSPKALRDRCRVLAARLLGRAADERMRAARAERCVTLLDRGDGMSELRVVLPIKLGTAIHERLTAQARAITAADPKEARSVDQLRADHGAGAVRARRRHAPGDDGRHRPDPHARRTPLCGWPAGVAARHDRPGQRQRARPRHLPATREAPRPRRSHVADVRLPACHRPARHCDLDHRAAWASGGATSADNLQPLGPGDHTVKPLPGWRVTRDPDDPSGTVWTTPSGLVATTTPPPLGLIFVEPPRPRDEEPPPY